MRISDWSSDVCSSDLPEPDAACRALRNGTDGRRRKCRGFQGIWWCCCRDLNSGPLPYQGSALPLSYSSPSCRKRPGTCHRGTRGASAFTDLLPVRPEIGPSVEGAPGYCFGSPDPDGAAAGVPNADLWTSNARQRDEQ